MCGSLSVSLRSKAIRKHAIGVICLLLSCIASGGAQSASKSYQNGGGSSAVQGIHIPFVPVQKDANGNVVRVAPAQKVVLPPEHMTEAGKRAKEAAEAGHAVPTTKPLVRELNAAEVKSLQIATPQVRSGNPGTPHPGVSAGADVSSATPAPRAGTKNESRFPGIGDTGFDPPDGGVAAGPFNVVAVVNSSIEIDDKNGNILGFQSLFDLFQGLPGAADGLFDPSVVYDADIGRFWVLATSAHDATTSDPTNRSNLLIAISNSSDVTAGGWTTFWLDATVNGNGSDGQRNACDYPHFGIDAQAIYFSCNMFSFPFFGNGSFQYSKVRILTKSQFTDGPCCSWWDFWNLREGPQNSFASFTIRPAIMHFSAPADGNFWINAEEDGFDYKVRRLTNAQNCCNGIGPTLEEADVASLSFSAPPGAAQPGTTTTIDTGDTRLLFATWQGGHLSTGQNLACNPGDANHACLGFAELDVSSYPSMTNVSDFAVGVRGEDLYYPFVEQNAAGDKTIVYNRSDGQSTFAGAYFRGIPNSGACTNCILGEGVLHLGQGNYIALSPSGENRWGDYHGAAADPDGLGVWIEAEYATQFIGLWATEVGPTYNNYVPSPSFSRNPIAFGNQTVLTTGALTEFVTNVGNATLNAGTVSIAGDPDFTIIFDGCSSAKVEQSQFCSLIVQFRPTKAGPGNATLNFPFNNFQASVGISGTGVKDDSVTALSSSKNPSATGTSVTFTATVRAASVSGTPAGMVTIKDGTGTLGTVPLSAGRAILTTSTLIAGSHNITANYGGNNNFHPSSASITQIVKQPTTTTLGASVNPSAFGQAVVFTASVVPAAAAGTVTFKDGAVMIGTSGLVSGKARLTSAVLAPGTHSITATYGGSTVFLGGTSGVLSHSVNKASTRTIVVSSHNPSVFGQSVTFTATVAAVAPGSGTPTGTVTFKNGGTVLSSGTLVSGKVTFSTAALAPGAHSITVSYNGSTDFNTSTSGVLAQTVNKATTKTTLVSSHNPSVFGQSVTFTATVAAVAPGSGTPTGTVTFKNGGTVFGSGTLVSGKVTFSTSILTRGTHSITTVYAGSVDHLGSTSGALMQTVN